MKLNFKFFALLFIGLFCSAVQLFAVSYSKDSISVSFNVEQTTVTITVINEHTFHIEKVRNDVEVDQLPDYVTVLEPQGVQWSVKETQDGFEVSTSRMKAQVSRGGDIAFYDAEGNLLSSEVGSESYICAESDRGEYAVRQSFTSQNEGQYGLGQFQSGRMNLNGAPVRLAQFNQEIAIPFIMSTKNYGIYWHNYSVTDVNFPEQQLDIAQPGMGATTSVEFTPRISGKYNFVIDSKNTLPKNRRGKVAMLTIDSDTIIHYATVWFPEVFSGSKQLEAGRTYTIKCMDWGAKTPTRVLYNEPDHGRTTFASRYGTKIDYYFVGGDSPVEVASQYTNLTGRAPMFDKAVFGFWQCRERYNTQAELLDNATQMRERQIPFDYIVQDWHYYPGSSMSPEWSRSKYPDPKAMVDSLNALNAKLMVSVWPSVGNDPLLENYGLTGRKMGSTNYLDFYDPEVCDKYYRMVSDSMLRIGVTSIWLDGSEPENKPSDDDKVKLGTFGLVANPYCLLVNKTMYEGHREEFGDKRVFNLTRSAYSGQQRYGSAVWSGDVAGTWEQFAEQIPAGLNIAMAGIPYWTTDIGGFFRDVPGFNNTYDDQYTNSEYIELLTRWFQYGTFNPLHRIHGFRSNTEIWRYGAEFEQVARKFIDIRYSLLPYIYSSSWQVTKSGKLLMSPLVYYYPEDKNCWEIKDQFLLGESLLVNPITTYKARSRELYLPQGAWYDYWTNKKIEGGRTIVADAPLNSLPLYIKAGSIMSYGAKVQYAAEQSSEPINLVVYPGGDALCTLYFDDNSTYDYERGEYMEVLVSYNQKKNRVEIKALENPSGYDYFASSSEAILFDVNIAGASKVKRVEFNGKKCVIKL